MKMNFLTLIRRLVPPYKGYLCLNVFFNLLATILSLFSFASIIPVLRILFGITDTVQTAVDTTGLSLFSAEWIDAMQSNLNFWIAQQVAAGGASRMLLYLGAFLILMTGFKCASSYLALFCMIPLHTGVLRDLRKQLYDKVLSLPIGYFTEEKRGDIMSRMTSDVNEVENSIVTSLDMIFRDPIMIIIYLTTLFVLSWQLTLFVLILLPTAGWLIGKIGQSLKQRSTRGQEQTAEILTQIDETLGGLRVVKAFNAEDKLRQRFLLQINATRQTFNRILRRYELAHPVSEFMGTALIAILLWYGGGLILSDSATIDAPKFIYYLIIFYSIINPCKDLTRATYSIRKGMASLERIDKILRAQSNITEPVCPQSLAVDNHQSAVTSEFISFCDVSFSYQPGVPVLQHINLQIPRGKMVAFVGQSGSGKTTLLDLVPRFYDPQQGAISVAGVDIRNVRTQELRNLMGIVNQDAILFNDTIFNNITFGVDSASYPSPQALMEAVRHAAQVANALEFIEATEAGFDTIIGDRGSRLSGGQRQRLSIARALLKSPEILILDEATSALDTESERLVQTALDNLMAHDCTKLVVAHRLSTIRNADLICVLHEGQIVEQGRHEELLAMGGYYAKLIQIQQE